MCFLNSILKGQIYSSFMECVYDGNNVVFGHLDTGKNAVADASPLRGILASTWCIHASTKHNC